MNDKYLALMLICFFAVSCKNKQDDSSVHHKTAAQQNSLVPPKITIIADLPDSLKPKVVSLDKMPGPLVVRVPERAGGSYTRTNDQGETQKIDLKPPVPVSLPVLKNEKGEIIKDKQGSPFIMGDGGISNFTNFSIKDGLAQNGVLCSIIDHSGNLWVGTDGAGVSRYDGKTFTTFNKSQGLAGVYVFSIMEDQSGNLWFCTWDGGVSRYDGKTFTAFKTGTALNDYAYVIQIAQDKPGNFWFVLTDGSVKCFAGKTYNSLKVPNGLEDVRVNRIFRDESGSLWFSTDKGARRYDGTKFKSYTTSDGLASNLVMNVVQDKSGDFWFGTYGEGVSRFNGEHFTTFTAADGLASNYIVDMTLGQSGNLWFRTDGGGVSRYDGKAFTSFTIDQGLAGNDVRCLAEDLSGNTWLGVYGEGLSRYGDNAFTFFGTSHGLTSNVATIFEDKAGNLWLASQAGGTSLVGGVTRYDGKTFTRFTTAQGLADKVTGVTEDQLGNVWFGTFEGICRYDGKTFTRFSTAQGLANNIVQCLAKDRSGNLWFATGAGASFYNGKEFTSFTTSQSIGPNINIILEDKSGNIWFGGPGGVSRYDGKAFITFTTAQGLAGNDVRCIAEDQYGNLWIGTEGGVSRYDGKEFTSFTTTEGLADDYVYGIAQDKQGNIVISTNVGLTVLNHTVISLPFSEVRKGITYYNSLNGYPIKDSYRNALYCDSKGIIWAGTDGNKSSLVRFDPSALWADTHTLSLVIQQIKINEEKIVWNDLLPGTGQKALPKTVVSPSVSANISEEVSTFGRKLSDEERERLKKRFKGISIDSVTPFYPLPVNLVLPYDHNQVTIDFNAIEVGSPSMINYQYILEGYDKDWSPVSKNTSATFGNMHEGAYTFKVKAQSPNGVWGTPVSYTFKVLPPWWRTWWAYAFYGLCFLTGVFFTDRIRRRIVVEKERAKARERELLQAKEIEKAYHTLKQTQAQLIQSEKMASLGELTAGIAHEIQNPLNFVNNFSEVNKELIDEATQANDAGNPNEVKELLSTLKENEDKINHHGKRADAIVKGMLQHSRSGVGVKELVNINAIADECLRLSYHGFRAKDKFFQANLQTDFDKSIEKFPLIQQDIVRVLVNLYNNAFYAINEKKKSAEVGRPEGQAGYEPTVSVSTQKTGNKITLTVKDNGSGIPQKVIDKIFQPFFTTKPAGQGTGLGLSLSYDIVKAHGGEINVESKEGEGSEFVIHLSV